MRKFFPLVLLILRSYLGRSRCVFWSPSTLPRLGMGLTCCPGGQRINVGTVNPGTWAPAPAFHSPAGTRHCTYSNSTIPTVGSDMRLTVQSRRPYAIVVPSARTLDGPFPNLASGHWLRVL